MLTDREAAEIRAKQVASEISKRVRVAIHSGRQDSVAVLRRELPSAVDEMLRGLCDVYAKLDGAAEPPLLEELTTAIEDRVVGFVKSSVAHIRGPNAVPAARLATDLAANVRMGAASRFKLAAYDAHRDKVKPMPPPPLPKVEEDARAAFDRLPIHPEIRVVCAKQFGDGHYREAILNAGIALIDYVKQRAGNPTDKQGKALDNTPLMQRVFGGDAPILKVNDLRDATDRDEQQGMMFLFSGATMGLRNPRAHSLDPDTAEYAVEAIAFISFLRKVAESAKS